MRSNAVHSMKDPAKLTPYEEKLVELKNKGLTFREMSEQLGGAASAQSLNSRYKIIREKLELLKYEQAN